LDVNWKTVPSFGIFSFVVASARIPSTNPSKTIEPVA
jgi:hypothetical protein